MLRRLLILVAACSSPASSPPVTTPAPPTPIDAAVAAKPAGKRTLTVIGTNDVHGQLERLPMFAGFVANARAARAADGGEVMLLDGGDMFQGTLVSNAAEGADIVRVYNQLGYTAVAVGNHEFDYGPVGTDVVAKHGEDSRGALKARASEAKFPFLVSNILDTATNARIDYPNMPASTIVHAAGFTIGILGVSTQGTPTTTMPANFADLRMMPSAAAIDREATALRGKGAQLVFAVMHVGSECNSFSDPDDDSSCDKKTELYDLLADVKPGTLDLIVAGHTHAGMAHRIHGTPVIESFSQARAFGRVDFTLDGDNLGGVKIFQPQLICPLDEHKNPVPPAECHPDPYEGRDVKPDAAVAKIANEAFDKSKVVIEEKLGVTLSSTVTKAYREESALGDLFTELMLASNPTAQVAMTNGGGLRTDLPQGELTYGQFFEAMPFDNRYSLVDVTGAQLEKLVRNNLRSSGGFMSWGGLDAVATCKGKKLLVDIKVGGKALDAKKTYTLVTSDFLTSGGDKALTRLELDPSKIHDTSVVIRDAMADELRKRKGQTIDGKKILAKKHVDYPGKRPVRCKDDEEETFHD